MERSTTEKYGPSVLLFIVLLALFFCRNGVLDYVTLKRDVVVKESTIEKIKGENALLKGRIDCLRYDDRCLEDAARKLGFIRDGEKLVYVAGK